MSKCISIVTFTPAGENYNETAPYSSVGSFCNDIFPRGLNTEWSAVKSDVNGKYHYREIKIDPKKAEDVKNFAVAHFMRTVHPINYFLVPKKVQRIKQLEFLEQI